MDFNEEAATAILSGEPAEARDSAIGGRVGTEKRDGNQGESPAISWERAIIPTLAPVQALYHSFIGMIQGGDLWSDAEGEWAPHYRRDMAGGQVYVYIGDGAMTEFAPDALPILWKTARAISYQTLIVAQAVLAQWASLATSVDQAVTISVDRILDYRGLQPIRKRRDPGQWRHGHRLERRREIAMHFGVLEKIGFCIIGVNLYPMRQGRKKPPKLTVQNSRFIAVTDVWGQTALPLERGYECLPSHIRYVPGNWIEEYARAGVKQLGRILDRNLSYDPYRQQWELAMAAWLTLEVFPNNAGGGRKIHRAVETILAAIGQQPDMRNPERTKQRFEAMMDQMKSDGYFSEWGYVDTSKLSARRWLHHWLKRRVWMEPAPTFDSFYSRRNPRRIPLSSRRPG